MFGGVNRALITWTLLVYAAGPAWADAELAPANQPSPHRRYGAMTQDECEAELVARKVPFVREPPTMGVRAPIRLTGPMHGVLYRSDLPAEKRATSPWEVVDCRLALALDDFARILARHGVVEVRHYSMYRRPDRELDEGREASRHPGGLAIDLGRLELAAGGEIDVYDDFNGRRGSQACGPKARPPKPATEKAKTLRSLLCEAVEQKLFTIVLTPNYNRKHRNHFHLEVAPHVHWFLVR
jgi:hypothetical protein